MIKGLYFLFIIIGFFLFQPSVLAATETCTITAYVCSTITNTTYQGVLPWEPYNAPYCPDQTSGTYAEWSGSSTGWQFSDCGLDSFSLELVANGGCPLGMESTSSGCSVSSIDSQTVGLYQRPGYSEPFCAQETVTTTTRLSVAVGTGTFENGDLISSNLSTGSNWEIAGASNCVPDEELPPDEPPPDDECPPGGDCVECANIICQCIESVKAIVQNILDVLRTILEKLESQGSDDSGEITPPPPIDKTEIEEAENPLQCGYDSLFEKFPFDIMGNLNGAASNTCPEVTLLAKSFEICWILDLVKIIKYPLIIGFLIRILLFL